MQAEQLLRDEKPRILAPFYFIPPKPFAALKCYHTPGDIFRNNGRNRIFLSRFPASSESADSLIGFTRDRVASNVERTYGLNSRRGVNRFGYWQAGMIDGRRCHGCSLWKGDIFRRRGRDAIGGESLDKCCNAGKMWR